jgi:hypothetical protein
VYHLVDELGFKSSLDDSRSKAERNKPTVKKPIKQKADMTKSRYDKKLEILNKRPICKKANIQKANMTKNRASRNKKPIWQKADLVTFVKSRYAISRCCKNPICDKPICKKADIQKADMPKSRYAKKPICQKADMPKSRYAKKPIDKKPIWQTADLVNLSRRGYVGALIYRQGLHKSTYSFKSREHGVLRRL